jgi:hypothetical protein
MKTNWYHKKNQSKEARSMGNEEALLRFRRIYISIYVNPAWSGQRHVGVRFHCEGSVEQNLQMWMGCKLCRPQTY